MSAYKHTPYFDYYADYIMPVYELRHKYLIDLNLLTTEIALSLLRNEPPKLSSNGLQYPSHNAQQGDRERMNMFTEDWSGLDLENYRGNGVSILDSLFRLGPLCLL